MLSSGQRISEEFEERTGSTVAGAARAADAGDDAELGAATNVKQVADVGLHRPDVGVII